MAEGGTVGQGLTLRALGAWAGMRGSMRRLLEDRPSESTLFVFILISGGLHFLGELARLWLAPQTAGYSEGELVSRVGAAFAGALIFRSLALYLVAIVGHGLARAFGGRGGGYESRAATAWAALVTAPVALAATLVGIGLAPQIGEQGANAIGQVGGIAFAYAMAHCFAEAHGFARTWTVLAVIALVILTFLGGTLLLAQAA